MEPAMEPELSFAGLLRQFRAEARLTQEELAEAAGVSPRSVSDLERGVNRTARKDTALLLADALSLAGQVRELFVAAARGRAQAAEVLAARSGAAPRESAAAAAAQTLPRDIGGFTGREPELARLLADVAADGGPAGIYAIDGMAGIGKTTRGARRAPADRQIPRWAVFPSAACPYPRPAAGSSAMPDVRRCRRRSRTADRAGRA
jgi:transcriptional regulator with XRE-family HTH domain